ncbi:MAG: DUF2314 domain-containing protein, partial [Planctomycetota bacterium]
EYRRIVPALSLSVVKFPFSDEEGGPVEQMWVNDIAFDGKTISGTLLNEPNELSSVSAGDSIEMPAAKLSDWMYAVADDRVFGAYTVNLLRARMSRGERKQHDAAWGLDFGDPEAIQIVPPGYLGKEKPKKGFFASLFSSESPEEPQSPTEVAAHEHPMAQMMSDSLIEVLEKDPSNATATDDRGFTYLHQLALAGTAIGVQILLDHGAAPNAKTNHGMTAADLAKTLGWKNVLAVLYAH